MNNNNTPKRRFKEFENAEAWEQRKLGDLAEIGDIDHRMPPTVEDGIPYLMTGDFCGINGLNFDGVKQISKEDYEQLSRKIKPEKGDIIFARYASVGAVRYVDFTRDFLISYSCAIIKKSKKINSKYLYHYLTGDTAQKQIKLEINSSSQANIGIDSMKNSIMVLMPSGDEQTKISEFLSNLDNLITLHQRKLDKLKKVKSAYLDEMFPKEGEKYPRRRFKGFSEPWEQRKLEECVDRIATGLNPRDNFKLNTGGTNYYVTIKNFEHGHLFLDDRCDKVDDDALKKLQERSDLQKDDILFTSIGRVGDCYLIESTPNNWNINESVFSLRPNQSVVIPEYLFQTIHCDVVLSQILNNITGSTFKSIKIGDLKKASIPVPNKEEQRKIGSFISNLDNLITLHQRKLDKLKRVKSAYLEEMFV